MSCGRGRLTGVDTDGAAELLLGGVGARVVLAGLDGAALLVAIGGGAALLVALDTGGPTPLVAPAAVPALAGLLAAGLLAAVLPLSVLPLAVLRLAVLPATGEVAVAPVSAVVPQADRAAPRTQVPTSIPTADCCSCCFHRIRTPPMHRGTSLPGRGRCALPPALHAAGLRAQHPGRRGEYRTNADVDVLVIGAGQAGLSAAYHLQRTGTSHVVVDAESGPGGAWRHRWPTLTMSTVNGITELPGSVVPPVDGTAAARTVLPAYFGDYETRYDLRVRRPLSIHRVESHGDLLTATAADGAVVTARALINATGTWTRPFWPYYPGAADFTGRQLHAHDYRGPDAFDGARLVVIGGGISAVQLLMEIAPARRSTPG